MTPLGTRLCSSTWDLREPVLWDLGRGASSLDTWSTISFTSSPSGYMAVLTRLGPQRACPMGSGGRFPLGDVLHSFLHFQPHWACGCAHPPGSSESPILWDLGGGFLVGDRVHCSLHFQPLFILWRTEHRAENSKLSTVGPSF